MAFNGRMQQDTAEFAAVTFSQITFVLGMLGVAKKYHDACMYALPDTGSNPHHFCHPAFSVSIGQLIADDNAMVRKPALRVCAVPDTFVEVASVLSIGRHEAAIV